MIPGRLIEPFIRGLNQQQLAAEAKVHQRVVAKVLARQEDVTFDQADRLLCAVNREWLWYVQPLRPYYDRLAT